MPDILPSPSHPHRTGRLRAMLLLGLLVLVLLTGALLSYLSPHGTGQRIGVGDTLTLAKDRRVLDATFRDEDALVVGDAKPGRGLLPQGGRFSAELPSNGELTASLTALLAATGAQVRVDHQDGKGRAHLLLTTLIPVLALADLVWLAMLSPRHTRATGTGWPAAADPAVAEVVVMSSNPTLAGTDLPSEVGTAPPVKTQGRRAPAGRHVRTSAARSSGSGDEEGESPPAKARKRAAAPPPAAKAAVKKAPAARAKATGASAAPPAKAVAAKAAPTKGAVAKKAPRGAASQPAPTPRKRAPRRLDGS
jgi:hypothetical protein